MSYVSTYDKRMPKPKGVGFAIAVHAVVIAAVIASPGIRIDPQDDDRVDTFDVPIDQPIEEISDPIEIKEDPITQKPTLTNPVKLMDDLPAEPDITPKRFTSDGSDITFGVGDGLGDDFPIDVIEDFQPQPDPVIIGAALNTRYAGQFQPRYPTGLLRLEEEGVVSVKVLVGTDGRAKDIKLLSTPHQDFWDSTRKHALRKWRFKPATEDGKPIESWITLKVKFEINT